MNEKTKGAFERIKEFFGKMTKKVRNLLIAALIAVVGVAVVVALVLNNRPYEVLFTDLTSDDAASIMSYLEENGTTDYRLENNDTILVPKDQEPMLKAKIMMANYPKSGFSYSTYFDNISAMSTESERQTALLFALQDRTAAVIRCLEGVSDANVLITQGEDRSFVLDSSNVIEASAAIQVTMKDGYSLTNQQASAIRSLVSRAVKGLSIDNISITDSLGNTYFNGESAASGEASALKLELEQQVNNRLRASIMQVLVPLYGEDNVRVAVNSTVDISRRVGESVEYSTPEGAPAGQGIIGSRVYDQEIVKPDGVAVGGVAGTTANADIPTVVQNNMQANGDETYIRNSGEENNNVNSNREQVERVAGTVSDVMVAVSINSTAAGNVNINTLRDHVARAAGIGADVQGEKISILPEPFYNPTTPPAQDEQNPADGLVLPRWAIYAAIGGGVLFLLLLLLIILLVRRSRRKRKQQELADMMDQLPPQNEEPPTQGADIMDIQTEKSMELRKDIRQFASDNPEIAAQMIKGWLRGGDKDHG